MKEYNELIFDISREGRRAYRLPELDVPDVEAVSLIPRSLLSDGEPELPEVSEVDVVRHFTLLSNKNYGVDSGFYPLGSCTMKYNPKLNEDMAGLPGFLNIHPHSPGIIVQGALELMADLSEKLSEIAGMDCVTLQPCAGAHGELTGLMIIKEYHRSRGDHGRTKIIVPDSAHGTNPASASVAGFEIVEIKSDEKGAVDLDALRAVLGPDTAGLMLTNPSTLGLFERNIIEIAALVHDAGGLLYYDGANMNAIMGKTRPGDMGFDIVHMNLHKTFSTPHGGGGPGSGPVGVNSELAQFLPVPVIRRRSEEELENDETGEEYFLDYDRPHSIGRVKNFYGNFGINVRAYSYILSMGRDGLVAASETAVLNANYMKEKLRKYYKLGIDEVCKHEFVLSGLLDGNGEISTLDIAKRLIDYGFHPPTIYFPLIVDSAMMIEPTETESLETLDQFIEALVKIAEEAQTAPELLKNAPHQTPVRRLDEVKAARSPILKWTRDGGK